MTTSLRTRVFLSLAMLTASLCLAAGAHADPYLAPSDQFPTPGAVYGTPDDSPDVPISGTTLRYHRWRWQDSYAATASPTPLGGDNWAVDSFFDIFYEIEFTGVGTSTGNGTGHVVGMGMGALDRTFDTEMISLDLVGTGGVMIRESPTLASTGQTRIEDLGGGLYRIDSFFDIFTELSLDGGQSWLPADGPVHVTSLPEPSTWVLIGTGALVLGILARRRRNKVRC